MKRTVLRLLVAFSVIISFSSLTAQEGYYRYPTLNDQALIFASEGDLWRLEQGKSQAQRLTTHAEEESHAFLSPDGNQVAFMAAYDGSFEAYVMPATGGLPSQVSTTGGVLRGWTPDGRLILTRTRATGVMDRVIDLIDPVSRQVEQLPLLNANHIAFVSNNEMFFSRYGLETSRDNARMYRGGTMSQLWHWNRGDKEATRLAEDFAAPIKYPMWHAGRLWFVSDKSGYDNLWSMKKDASDIKQHTKYNDFGIRSPQLAGNSIVYQLAADIYQFDLNANKADKLAISLASDQDRKRVRWINNPMERMTSANLGHAGKRVAVTARGQVAIASPGPLRRITLDIPETARARGAVLGSKDKYLYVIIDDNDQGEIWQYSLKGKASPKQLTKNTKARIWSIHPSPDGKWLVYSDNLRRLWMLNISSGKQTQIDEERNPGDGGFGGFTWSKEGDLLAYSHGVAGVRGQVSLYNLTDKKVSRLTSDKYSSYSPAFSADNKFLYFLSQRHFATPDSVWRDRMMGPSFHKRAKVYALALDAKAQFPFTEKHELMPEKKPDSDKKKDKKDDKKKSKKDSKKKEVKLTKVDWDGLTLRLYEVPVGNGDFNMLAATKSHLFVLDDPGRGPGTLKSIEIKDKDAKLETFSGGVDWFELSADGKKMLYAKPGTGNLFLVKTGAKAPKDLKDSKLRTSDWRMALSPTAEWKQMFLDAWRMHRDFSFDKKMRGTDWGDVKSKLLPLVDRIGDRTELNDVLSHMAENLGILHSQVGSGDINRDSQSAQHVTLGGIFESTNAGLKINHIYQGEPELVEERVPLAGPDKNIMVGDILTHVNGRPVSNQFELDNQLSGLAGQQVLLTLKRDKKTWDEIVKPVSLGSERMMRYNDWVESRSNYVSNKATNIGYLHVRAMGGRDAANYARDFYAHTDKDGLIIDVRANRGGNIDSWLLTSLLKQVWAFWHFNAGPEPYGNMQQTFRGHVVVLFDQYTYSDGETFSAGVKATDIGHTIGTRTAGAGIWLSDRNRLTDNGIVRVAESAQYDMQGNWLLEGWGVSPDQEVVNPPVAAYKGKDAQLDAAIKYLEQKIKDEPIPEFRAGPIHPIGKSGADVK